MCIQLGNAKELPTKPPDATINNDIRLKEGGERGYINCDGL